MATITPAGYFKFGHGTPEKFENERPGSKILIISSGPSTAKLLKHKENLRNHFDAIICVNYSVQDFDGVSDYHIVVERTVPEDPISVHAVLAKKEYRTDIPRIVNWNGIHFYDPKYNLYKTTRSNFYFKPNIRKYKCNDSEGLLCWKIGDHGWSTGTSVMSAMHLAGIIGAEEIYLIGNDLLFRDEFDHYYKDKIYRGEAERKSIKKKHLMDIVTVELDGKTYESTNLFRDSADSLNEVIPTVFKDISVYDFSRGLVKAAIPLDIDEFMQK